jgi:hypothetical protein
VSAGNFYPVNGKGGAAFPSARNSVGVSQPGMTLRDHFAGLVLAGICASDPLEDFTDEHISKACYSLADAMLLERDR